MPKVRKLKRTKTYKVNINRKRLRNKMRKLPDIGCPQVKAAWENSKSTRMNLLQMGLAYDPNKSLKIPNMKTEMLKDAKQIAVGGLIRTDGNKNKQKQIPKKIQVAMALEEDANAPRESTFRLPKGHIQFLTSLMDKYGDDYEAMARDKKNYYQLTWRQIKSKINTFKGIPEQYAEYLLQKGDIVLDDPEPLKETKKKIAEENVKKYCARKKPKKQKQSVSQWIEESIEDEEADEFDTMDTVEDEDSESEVKLLDGEKRLKLFPDDKSDQEEKEETRKKNLKNKHTKESNNKQNKAVKQNHSEMTKKGQLSSDDESDLEDDENDDASGFKDLNSMSDEDVSDDDMLNDDEFDSDSD